MNNYFFSEIEDHRNTYPDASSPEVSERFSTLEEYLTMAKKILKRVGPLYASSSKVNLMLNSEDYISELARYLMVADWRYEEGKGKTRYSYRNQYAIYFFKDNQSKYKTKANKYNYSLDISNDDLDSMYSVTEDLNALNPVDSMNGSERKERIRNYVEFLINNSNLSSIQKKCIVYKFIEGVDSCHEIGLKFDPPITRQAVQQAIKKAMFKFKQNAFGTKNEVKTHDVT